MFRSSPKLRRHVRGDFIFGPMFFFGILAAIAVPAYQDYTIRSQVTEGLNLAGAVKAATAEYYLTTGKWPASLKAAGFDRTPRGKYVGAVTIKNGIVVIRYGAQANGLISGLRLTLRPTITTTAPEDVVWSCGYSQDPGDDPESGPAAPHATTIAQKYLPRSCRGSPEQ